MKKFLSVVSHIVQWIAAVFCILFAIVAFTSGGVAGGIIFLIAALIVSPLIEKTPVANLKIPKLPAIQCGVAFVLFVTGAIVTPTDKNNEKTIERTTPVAEISETSVSTTAMETTSTVLITTTITTTTSTTTETTTSTTVTTTVTTTTETTTIPETTTTESPTEPPTLPPTEPPTEPPTPAPTEPPAPVIEEPQPVEQNNDTTYLVNTDSNKFHYPSCRTIKNYDDPHWEERSCDRQQLLDEGYSPCGVCNP